MTVNKKYLTMKKITVVIERDAAGEYTAVPQHDYPVGFFGCGKSVEEALSDLDNSHREAKEILPELPDFEYAVKYDTASFLQYFGKKLSLAGLQAITGISRKQLSHYMTGHSKPSQATVRKIEEGLHRFQKELSHVALI